MRRQAGISDRAHGIDLIRQGALVRSAVAESAIHRVVDKKYEVILQGRRFIGATLEAVIEAAKTGRTTG